MNDHDVQMDRFGYHLERRWFLKSASALGLVTLLSAESRAANRLTRMDALDWDGFIEKALVVAKANYGLAPDEQDRYLYALASLASQLEQAPEGELTPYGTTGSHLKLCFRGSPFIVLKWRLDPGGYLPAHNHPDASVCTLCLDGETRVRNFEIVGQAPAYDSGQPVILRQTHDQALTKGRINTLSGHRDNIHFFQAGPKGASGIDITSMHGSGGPFSFLDINPTPQSDGLLQAKWTGNKPI